ncbi:hypothetical protein N8258_00380 [Algibacter sp.]|nr:hypothetical protein [Algibacter sp.]MDA9070114.1 hypothetical protein [Algibacter sp.]MDC1364856.1 hypothetical protein [Algibacter sp.]
MLDFKTYFVTKKTVKLIFITPIITTLLISLLFAFPSTNDFGFWLLKENSPIELLTFIIFLCSGIYGIHLTLKVKALLKNEIKFFLIFFSICLILIAMEEISWGQWFFHFETPTDWAKINGQGETTLHNIKGMQGNSEILRMIFGLGGIFGIMLRYFKRYKIISAPPALISWFLIIFIHAAIDYIQDKISISVQYDFAIVKTSEFIELLIAGSSFFYLWLNFKKLGREIM